MQKNRGTFDSVRRCFDECFDWVDELFPDFGSCELHEDTAAGSDNGAGADRQYAYCKNSKPMIIAFAPKARQLTMSSLRGLMRHEFGHALEYRYGVAELERRLGKLPETVERRADVIAERVWGDPIVYDERLVQCVGKNGTHPRPKHLPDRKEKLKANGRTTMELWHASPVPDLDRRGFDPSLGSEFGIYLTPRRRYAMNYGPYLYRVTARFSNPVIVWGKGQISPADLTEEDVDALREQGYDSIVVSDTETMKDASEVVLFDNDQVVSIERVH